MTNASPRLIILIFITIMLVGCHVSAPQSRSDVLNTMMRYSKQGRYDVAIRAAQDWIEKHPEDSSGNGFLYEQIAMVCLIRASREPFHKDRWIEQAATNFDKSLSLSIPSEGNIDLYTFGRGYETAGDMSAPNRCQYYGRALKAFEQQGPLLNIESITVSGNTMQMAPIRRENKKALGRVKEKFANAGCK